MLVELLKGPKSEYILVNSVAHIENILQKLF